MARRRAPGLDGVRALAVLAVMGFHEGARALTGGFLGVDVFFVLSGFLITDLLATQPRDLRAFWLRRARRLLPPLAVMLVVVTAAATIIEPAQGATLRNALLAAVTYTSNWYQLLHHVPYFDSFGPQPPLEHLWSLAIEEQFYLIWPLILWFLIFYHNDKRAWITATLFGAAGSAVAMALLYRPSDPSAVYYATETHASGLLIGAALALALPLRALADANVATIRRLDAAGVAGLAVLAWAVGHFSGNEAVVYPVGLLVAALAAAALIAAAASRGAVAAIASWAPLRWIGVRSYAIYLWHWPVIALTGRYTRSPLTWMAETCVTVALAAASWRFAESPILREGFEATCRAWYREIIAAFTYGPRRAVGLAASAAVVTVIAIAGYGILVPARTTVPDGLLRQVAEGQRLSAASQALSSPRPTRPRPVPRVRTRCAADGRQVSAVGDSVMLASASALEADLPGIYLDAKVGMQMPAGVRTVRHLAASGRLRHFVVVGLGTNGAITADEISALRAAAGPHRELILINTFGPMSWELGVNKTLASSVWHKRHVELLNWAGTIGPHPSMLWTDGIHPRPAGASRYARMVKNAIAGTCR